MKEQDHDEVVQRARQSKCNWIARNKRLTSKASILQFDVEGVLGEGLLGSVRLATFKSDKKYCVLKCMLKEEVQHHKDERHVINERNILGTMNHPFVVGFFGAFQDKLNLYLCLELVVGGELFRYLHLKRKFDPPVARFYSAEIFLALDYIHSLGWVYRDLKPENVMLDEEGHLRLVDFGFARMPDEDGKCHTHMGTPQYLSPEQLSSKGNDIGYSVVVDWWAFGCMLFEFLTGSTPFSKPGQNRPIEIYTRIMRGRVNFPKGFDTKAKLLVKDLLHKDVNKRVGEPTRIKNYEWFEDVPWRALERREVATPYTPTVSFPGDRSNFDSSVDDSKRPVEREAQGKVDQGDRKRFEGF